MTIEFVIAAVIFFSLLLYVVLHLNSGFSEYREDFSTSDIWSRAVQVSDLLVHNRDLGISGGYPVISNSSLHSLNETCKDRYSYIKFLDDLDLKHRRVKIQVNESLTGNSLLDCGPEIPEKATNAGITRFGLLDTTNEPVIISLWVW